MGDSDCGDCSFDCSCLESKDCDCDGCGDCCSGDCCTEDCCSCCSLEGCLSGCTECMRTALCCFLCDDYDAGGGCCDVLYCDCWCCDNTSSDTNRRRKRRCERRDAIMTSQPEAFQPTATGDSQLHGKPGDPTPEPPIATGDHAASTLASSDVTVSVQSHQSGSVGHVVQNSSWPIREGGESGVAPPPSYHEATTGRLG